MTQSACGAGGSIKPGVERSGTPGSRIKMIIARAGDSVGRTRWLTPTQTSCTTSSSRQKIAAPFSRIFTKFAFTITSVARSAGLVSLELNGTEDHLHLLTKLRPDKALSDVLLELKANASGWMHDVFPEVKIFSWQRGYGAFMVSQSNVEEVRQYIAGQKEHHAKISFRDEFLRF